MFCYVISDSVVPGIAAAGVELRTEMSLFIVTAALKQCLSHTSVRGTGNIEGRVIEEMSL